MTLQRMDNVLIVVDDLEAVKAFFVEIGMELEGESSIRRIAAYRVGVVRASDKDGFWS